MKPERLRAPLFPRGARFLPARGERFSRKRPPARRRLLALCFAALAGCAVLPRARTDGPGLDGAAFAGLPPPARAYLLRLAAAWEAHDAAFLLAQGEASYEAALRPHTAPDRYAALLYRAGPYAENGARDYGPADLDIRAVKSIRYLSWGEAGPLIMVECRLLLAGGGGIPCILALLWRLPGIRILGVYP